MVWVRGGFRVRVKVGDSFRVRDRASVRAESWLGFMQATKLLDLKLHSGGGFGKKQNCVKNFSKSPQKMASRCN